MSRSPGHRRRAPTCRSPVAGLASRQFGNPMAESDPKLVMLTLAAVFLLPMSAPALVFNLAYCKDSSGGWLLRSAPVARPLGLAIGACKAVQLWVVTPLCVAERYGCTKKSATEK